VRATLKRLAGFAVAGLTGFIIDAGITEALVELSVSPYVARIGAVAVAIGVTYTINRHLTFGDRRGTERGRRLRYVAVSLLAIAVNYAAFALTIALMPGVRPIAGVIVGTAIGMVINYVGYSRFVFTDRRTDQAA
jgi:putative flippase GtrA